MAKMFAISTHIGGTPIINMTDPTGANYTPCTGWVQCGTIGQYGAYIFSGTGDRLLAINALSNVIGLVAMTESGNVRWAELDGTITVAQRTKWNTWLSARGYPTIPVGATYRAIVMAVYKRLNNLWDLQTHDILDSA